MRTIYKYPLSPSVQQTIHVPLLKTDLYSAMSIKEQILKLDMQDGRPYLWIMVDNEERERAITVTFCQTGQQCYEPIEDYVDSFQKQLGDTNFVFHVFVREKNERRKE